MFSFASFIASSTISIPITFLACLDIKLVIVPVPQYKSSTISSFFSLANLIAVSYNISVVLPFI